MSQTIKVTIYLPGKNKELWKGNLFFIPFREEQILEIIHENSEDDEIYIVDRIINVLPEVGINKEPEIKILVRNYGEARSEE